MFKIETPSPSLRRGFGFTNGRVVVLVDHNVNVYCPHIFDRKYPFLIAQDLYLLKRGRAGRYLKFSSGTSYWISTLVDYFTVEIEGNSFNCILSSLIFFLLRTELNGVGLSSEARKSRESSQRQKQEESRNPGFHIEISKRIAH